MKKLLSLLLTLLVIHTIVFEPVMGYYDDYDVEDVIPTDEWKAMEYGGTLETWGDFRIICIEGNASFLKGWGVVSPDGKAYMVINYTGKDTEITLPEGIHIMEGIYSPIRDDITVIHLPESMQKIDYESLYGMKSLKKVDMKNNVTLISAYAFCACTSLSEISISDSLKHISNLAFKFCTSLKHIDLPEGLESIYDGAFENTGLTEITIPSTVEKVDNAFSGCPDLEKIVITSSDTELTIYSSPSPNTVIYAPRGSKAEKAAKAAGIPFKAIALNRSSLSLTKGKSYQLKFNCGSDATSWKSSNSKIVSVDKNGKITAKKNGTATITATLYGKKYTCKVTVGAKTYTVKRGDTLWGIASKQLGSGYRYKEIMKLNGLKSTMIVSGQRLKLPER